ncbi:MAG: CHAT domain-containing protein [Candidatus Electrothrix sp. AUS1_2]|nr:CHAT domain-containing protein [Candidatus Electrothrix sp. AUS1_2]
MEKSVKIIEYRIVVQSDDVIQVYAGHKRDDGKLNREPLEEARDDYLEELEESGRLNSRIRIRNLGRRLYKALFNGNVTGHFRENILRSVSVNQEVFCRINLVFQKNVDPCVISLPWEFLVVPPDKDIFLGTHPQFSLSYTYEDWLTHPLPPDNTEKDFSLRVLFVHFHPEDLPGIGPAMVRKDIQRLKDSDQAEFLELTNPTVREIEEKIRAFRPHVFHFLTHGRFDHKKGEVALLDREGKTLWYDDHSFGDLFQSWKPQVVVLQACESGRLSEIKAFAGPAGSLMRQQIPAVVSMRYPIEQKHAWAFNAEFYQALAANEPIDFAVQKGRHALAISDDAQGHSSHEFAIPTLWMRSQSYSLFPTDAEQDEADSACFSPSPEQSSHPADIRAYWDVILSNLEKLKLDKRYVDLSAVTSKHIDHLFEEADIPPEFAILNRSSATQKQEEKLLNSITEALAIHPRFVLLGAPGCGKTYTLKKLLLDRAKLAKQDTHERIPLLFSLSEWPDETNNIPDLIQKILVENGLQPIHINRLLLLLDGLNEVSAQTYIPRVGLLEDWLRNHPEVSVIISCRQKHYQNNKRLSIPEVQIKPFDSKRIKLFLDARLGTESAQRLLSQLEPSDPAKRSSRDLIHLADNPYFLLMIYSVYKDNKERVPSSRGLLFQKFVKTLYEREKNRRLTRGLSAEELDASLSTLAFEMQKRRSATSVHLAWAEKQLPRNISSEALWELSRGASLVQFAKEERFVQFTHQLLLEYFAAEYLFQRLDNFPENIIRKPGVARHQRKGQPWDEVIYTLAGIAEPNGLLKKIAETDPFLAEDCFAHLPMEAEINQETLTFIITRLIDFFDSRSVKVRRVAVARLITIGEATIPYLTKILQSKKRKHVVKRSALRVLAAFDNFEALYAIFSALDDTGWVRKDAQKILDDLDNSKIQALLNGIDFSSPADSEKAIELIQRYCDQDAVRLEKEILPVLQGEVKEVTYKIRCFRDKADVKNPKVNKELQKEFAKLSREDKLEALKAVCELGNEERAVAVAVSVCLEGIKDESASVKIAALETLREFGNKQVVVNCLPLLEDKKIKVRIAVLKVLGELGDEQIAEICLPFLKDDSIGIRVVALNTLRELGGNQMAKFCLPLLEDKSIKARIAALKVLGKLGNEQMAERCLPLLKDGNPYVRVTALNALRKLDNKQTVENCLPLLKDEHPQVRRAALLALGKLGNEQTAAHFLQLLKDKYSMVRETALLALGKLGNEETVEHCLPLLKDKKPKVRQAALLALGKLGNEQTAAHFLPLLKDEEPNVRQAALTALRKLGNEHNVEHCLPLLNDKDSNVRISTLNVLCKLGNEEFAEHCLPLLKDESSSVRKRAKEVIEQLQAIKDDQ